MRMDDITPATSAAQARRGAHPEVMRDCLFECLASFRFPAMILARVERLASFKQGLSLIE